jgi:hypothetical protein
VPLAFLLWAHRRGAQDARVLAVERQPIAFNRPDAYARDRL